MSQEILTFFSKNFRSFSRISVWLSPCRIAIQLQFLLEFGEEMFTDLIIDMFYQKLTKFSPNKPVAATESQILKGLATLSPLPPAVFVTSTFLI